MGSSPPESCGEANPFHFLEDLVSGLVGSSAVYFVQGVYNSPSGARLVGGSQAVGMNARRLPRDAARFAVFCGLHKAFKCSMAHARGKEDPWNNIVAAGAAGGLIQIHRGLRASAAMAFGVGAVLALYEGSVIMVNKLKQAKLSRANFLV